MLISLLDASTLMSFPKGRTYATLDFVFDGVGPGSESGGG